MLACNACELNNVELRIFLVLAVFLFVETSRENSP